MAMGTSPVAEHQLSLREQLLHTSPNAHWELRSEDPITPEAPEAPEE